MLIFQNDGVLPIEGFTTFGMSAKPGSTNPIGKFGTGLKNTVAIILRLGGTIRVWRGLEEYVFYTKAEDFRGQTFERVRMKKRSGLLSRWQYEILPFTTELGKHWKPWMAFRELEANTRDEENGRTHQLDSLKAVEALPKEGTTLIVVDCKEIEEAYANIDTIFLPERKPIFEDAQVRVYDGPSTHVFYRGMRVTDLRKPSLFTYEMKHVMLTEDRTSMYSFLDDRNMRDALLACPDASIINKVVKDAEDHHEGTFDWDEKKPKSVSAPWHTALGRTGLSSRFSTMRSNLQFGIGSREDVEITMEVRMWEKVLETMKDVDESITIQIREQLVEAGWRDTSPASADDAQEPESSPDEDDPSTMQPVPDAQAAADQHGKDLDDEIPF